MQLASVWKSISFYIIISLLNFQIAFIFDISNMVNEKNLSVSRNPQDMLLKINYKLKRK
jgi:hypothetical protein